jgi:purine-nucleoside phosphorylase
MNGKTFWLGSRVKTRLKADGDKKTRSFMHAHAVAKREGKNMPTPHNAANKGDIAKVVLMPGDPLRAQYVAEHFFDDVSQFSDVRNMLGFTGTYKGVPVSAMGSGMGIPSIAIYSWELYTHYDVDTIIHIGSTGALSSELALRDIVLAQGACTNSAYLSQFGFPGTFAPIADFGLLRSAVESCERYGIRYQVGNVMSTDVFYGDPSNWDALKDMGVLGLEMEAAGLYFNAAKLGKRALAIMTVSDCPLTGESLDAHERQASFTEMMQVALDVAISCSN